MSYFNLRKHAPEPEPDDVVEEVEAVEEAVADGAEEQPAKQYGPLLTGLLGPGRWIAARFGMNTAWTVHGIAVWAVAFYGGLIAAGVVVAWLFAVLLFVPREYLEKLAARVEGSSSEEDQAAGEGPAIDPLVPLLWRLIGDAPGVHLKTVVKHLQKAAPEQPVDRPAVRAKLGALGITVRGSVRDAAGRVNEGVHGDDLQAWEEALPPTETGTPSEARSDPYSDALTSSVGKDATVAATPLPWLRRLLPRGGA